MPDPGVSWVTGGGSRAAAGGSRAAAGGSWVAPSIRIPIHSPVPPARSPQPLPRPLVRAAQAALRERAPQAEFVAPTGQMFEVLHSTTPPRVEAPAYTHYRALGSLAGQRLAAHHAHEHVPCLAEYAAILRAHEEEVRKNRPGYSRQAARQERELTLTPSRPKTPAASVFSADTPSPSPPRSEGGYSTKPDRSTGARAGKPSADGTAACAGSAQDHADQNGSTSTYVSFDQFVAQHAAVYATELAAARTLTSVLATARAAVPGTQRASTWGPTEPSDAQQGSNAARDDEESADLSVAYVLRPPVRSSVSPLPADSAGGEWRDAVAAEVERRHDARHGGAARYEHGQHVLHFGGAPAVHAKCCVALGEQLRRTRAEFKTLTQLQMEHVLSSASVMLFARYCMVYRQGSLAQHLFLLIDGELSRHELDGSTSKLQLPNYAINSAEQQTVYGPTLFGEASAALARAIRARARARCSTSAY
ncbi:hypothetical protein KFE25_013415 [Diacronema lutheri]|uniref:Cyclic nucleotide-binding domain-containing protein n=1 Tax=Diacronema lutheri TaxID=2081491 RepID=A0A8J5XTX1_DIALT|nr:hypothetical protein KFE25_013415 [Diacronema lutheri]